MSWLGCLAFAACDSPTPAEMVPCGANDACPSGQQCHAGFCYATPPVDTASLDADPEAAPDAPFACTGVQTQLGAVEMTLGTPVTETVDLRLYAGRQQTGPTAFAGEITDNKAFQGVIHTSQ